MDPKERSKINQEEIISIKEFCHILSVSEATGRNWLRLGKLAPDREWKGKPYFSKEYVRKFQGEGKQAGKCVKCGKCEGLCPQKLHIRQDLEKVQEDMDRKEFVL